MFLYWLQWKCTYLSDCPAFAVLSALIRVSAAAASSNAQLTDDVNLLSTSGSAKALPSAVDNLPIPIYYCHTKMNAPKEEIKQNSSYLTLYMLSNNLQMVHYKYTFSALKLLENHSL